MVLAGGTDEFAGDAQQHVKLTRCIEIEKEFGLDLSFGFLSARTEGQYLHIEFFSEYSAESGLWGSGPARLRAPMLTLFNALALFTLEAYIPHQMRNSSYGICDEPPPIQAVAVREFVVNGRDFSTQLETLLRQLTSGGEASTVLLSVLDRHRKALYFRNSVAEGTAEEESVLLCYGILEMLSNAYQPAFGRELDEAINKALRDLSSRVLRCMDTQTILSRRQQVRYSLLGSSIPVQERIAYALDKLGLWNQRVSGLLERMGQARNASAHGRTMHRDPTVYPLPAFLSGAQHYANEVADASIQLVAQVACRLAGISLYVEEWNQTCASICPPVRVIRGFIRHKTYETISRAEFATGACDGVTPECILELLMSGAVGFTAAEDALACFLDAMSLAELDPDQAISILLILQQSSNATRATDAQGLLRHYEREEARLVELISDDWKSALRSQSRK